MNKIEKLLQPRYMPIFVNGKHYPKSIFGQGEIITGDTDGPRMSEYPHLFRKLEWWQCRKIEDMPEFVKIKGKEIIIKTSTGKWGTYDGDVYIFNYSDGGGTLCNYLTPATEEQYITYIKSKQ